MEVIKSGNDCTIAIIIRREFDKDGINFVSDKDFPLQLGINSYSKNYEIQGHIHKPRKILINNVQEVIYFKKGKALITLFDLNKEIVRSVELSSGDLIFFVSGGHSFSMIEDTTLIEVKQGPYFGKSEDKELI